jgi:short-chain fatty acids transporter
VGLIFNLISWGWIVLAAVLARELARRVKGVDYRLLAACVYTTNIIWHGGLSGSIPLVINTPNNFLFKAGVLDSVIPTTTTLLSPMNITVAILLLIVLPILMVMLKPRDEDVVEFDDMVDEEHKAMKVISIEEEADSLRLPGKNISDFLNNNFVIQIIISLMGVWFLVWHFAKHGFDINLNIMNFIFIILGMICHKTPFRYLIAMKRACGNVSGIILQFPFYAGIMGIMIHTGLGKAMAMAIASVASVGSYPFIAFLIGGFVNIFVPSGGGEWAVVGPTVVEAARTLGASMTPDELTSFIARISMAVGYGDAWTNMIQPFWTLTFMPIIAAGTKMQARDFMGYTFITLLCAFFIFAICVTWVPV